MSFLLRASLVIGALTYLALPRQAGPERPASSGIGATGSPLADLPELRARAERAAEAEILRRLSALGPSQDTLTAADRRVPGR